MKHAAPSYSPVPLTLATRSAITAISAVAALTVLTASSAAFAQDEENFEGVSIGAQGGYSRQSVDETVLTGANAAVLDERKSGITYGGYIGYDAQFEQFVLGAEAGFSPNGRTITGDVTGGGTVNIDPKWSADASVRAGVVLGDRVLFYGRAGYSRTRLSINRFASGNADAAIATQTENRDGFMFGGGAEFAVNRNAALRVEYRRTNLSGSLRSDQVLAGATLRF